MQKIKFCAANFKIIAVCVFVGVIGRVLPHVPNVTPLTSISLFAGAKLPKSLAYATLLLTLALSDFALSRFQGYPVFSSWSFFTYTGFAAIAYFGSWMQKKRSSYGILLSFILSSSLFFWVWTNFGVWLTSGLYAHTIYGLGMCYVSALPFLRNEMLGNLIWSTVIFGALRYFQSRAKFFKALLS